MSIKQSAVGSRQSAVGSGQWAAMNIIIERSLPSEHSLLTEIAFAAKRHWHYPEDYFDVWKNELTITAEYINKNIVYSAKNENRVIGFYSIVENPADFHSGDVFVPKGFWLEHIFILPEFHHLGIGRELIRHIRHLAPTHEIEKLLIFVDPFARGFYDKIGAEFRYISKSTIPNRFIPVYELTIAQPSS
jgi:maltose O-acetyltransferase